MVSYVGLLAEISGAVRHTVFLGLLHEGEVGQGLLYEGEAGQGLLYQGEDILQSMFANVILGHHDVLDHLMHVPHGGIVGHLYMLVLLVDGAHLLYHVLHVVDLLLLPAHQEGTTCQTTHGPHLAEGSLHLDPPLLGIAGGLHRIMLMLHLADIHLHTQGNVRLLHHHKVIMMDLLEDVLHLPGVVLLLLHMFIHHLMKVIQYHPPHLFHPSLGPGIKLTLLLEEKFQRDCHQFMYAINAPPLLLQ